MAVHSQPSSRTRAPLEGLDEELGQLLGAGGAPLDLTDPVGARKVSRERAARRHRSRERPSEIEVSDHRVDGAVGHRIEVRLYRPRERIDAVPGLIHFHGGAFVVGNLDTEDWDCAHTSAGVRCAVLSVAYRLAPEHPFPAALNDGMDVLRWATARAASLGIDPARLGVSGTSAGGCIAAAVALLTRDRRLTVLRVVDLTYPVLDDRSLGASSRWSDTPVLTRAELELMWRHYRGPEPSVALSEYLAPARHVDLSGLPPVQIVIAELDPLRDEALAFAQRVRDADGVVGVRRYAGAVHGFDRLGETELGRRARAERIAALNTVFQTIS